MESARNRALELRQESSGRDELDERIDRTLGRVGAMLRALFIVAVIAFVGIFVIVPHLDEWSQYILTGASLLFRLLFAILFIVIQFVALFWFLGRPRIYWVMP